MWVSGSVWPFPRGPPVCSSVHIWGRKSVGGGGGVRVRVRGKGVCMQGGVGPRGSMHGRMTCVRPLVRYMVPEQ